MQPEQHLEPNIFLISVSFEQFAVARDSEGLKDALCSLSKASANMQHWKGMPVNCLSLSLIDWDNYTK